MFSVIACKEIALRLSAQQSLIFRSVQICGRLHPPVIPGMIQCQSKNPNRGKRRSRDITNLEYTNSQTQCSFSTASHGNRRWQTTKLGDSSPTINMAPKNQTFTLMSYNILAQKLIDEHQFIYENHTAKYLNWNHRLPQLIDEILSIQPQILCLQEVQQDHLQQIVNDLRQLNFNFVYKKRTGSNYTDGCAIFYNTDLFELQERHTVEYYQENVTRLDRPNVGLIAKLRVRSSTNTSLLIATTHLLYNPRRQDVRLAQVQLLLAELDRLSAQKNNSRRIPIILTGDFNLQPYTAPYRLIVNGQLQYANLTSRTLLQPLMSDNLVGNEFLPANLGITDDCQHLSVAKNDVNPIILIKNSENPLQRGENLKKSTSLTAEDFAGHNFQTGTLSHQLRLASVFHHNRTVNGNQRREATTYHEKWITVDYMFYSKFFNKSLNRVIEGDLKLLERYDVPSVQECEEVGNIPNEDLGSDHYSLAARFLIKLN